MTAIADFEQRWRQRGKTVDCSSKNFGHSQYIFAVSDAKHHWLS